MMHMMRAGACALLACVLCLFGVSWAAGEDSAQGQHVIVIYENSSTMRKNAGDGQLVCDALLWTLAPLCGEGMRVTVLPTMAEFAPPLESAPLESVLDLAALAHYLHDTVGYAASQQPERLWAGFSDAIARADALTPAGQEAVLLVFLPRQSLQAGDLAGIQAIGERGAQVAVLGCGVDLTAQVDAFFARQEVARPTWLRVAYAMENDVSTLLLALGEVLWPQPVPGEAVMTLEAVSMEGDGSLILHLPGDGIFSVMVQMEGALSQQIAVYDPQGMPVKMVVEADAEASEPYSAAMNMAVLTSIGDQHLLALDAPHRKGDWRIAVGEAVAPEAVKVTARYAVPSLTVAAWPEVAHKREKVAVAVTLDAPPSFAQTYCQDMQVQIVAKDALEKRYTFDIAREGEGFAYRGALALDASGEYSMEARADDIPAQMMLQGAVWHMEVVNRPPQANARQRLAPAYTDNPYGESDARRTLYLADLFTDSDGDAMTYDVRVPQNMEAQVWIDGQTLIMEALDGEQRKVYCFVGVTDVDGGRSMQMQVLEKQSVRQALGNMCLSDIAIMPETIGKGTQPQIIAALDIAALNLPASLQMAESVAPYVQAHSTLLRVVGDGEVETAGPAEPMAVSISPQGNILLAATHAPLESEGHYEALIEVALRDKQGAPVGQWMRQIYVASPGNQAPQLLAAPEAWADAALGGWTTWQPRAIVRTLLLEDIFGDEDDDSLTITLSAEAGIAEATLFGLDGVERPVEGDTFVWDRRMFPSAAVVWTLSEAGEARLDMAAADQDGGTVWTRATVQVVDKRWQLIMTCAGIALLLAAVAVCIIRALSARADRKPRFAQGAVVSVTVTIEGQCQFGEERILLAPFGTEAVGLDALLFIAHAPPVSAAACAVRLVPVEGKGGQGRGRIRLEAPEGVAVIVGGGAPGRGAQAWVLLPGDTFAVRGAYGLADVEDEIVVGYWMDEGR